MAINANINGTQPKKSTCSVRLSPYREGPIKFTVNFPNTGCVVAGNRQLNGFADCANKSANGRIDVQADGVMSSVEGNIILSKNWFKIIIEVTAIKKIAVR